MDIIHYSEEHRIFRESLRKYLAKEVIPHVEAWEGKRIKKVGWHSQDTAELYFTDCHIPKANRLGEKGTGFLKLMLKLQQERLVCAIGAVGAAEYILKNGAVLFWRIEDFKRILCTFVSSYGLRTSRVCRVKRMTSRLKSDDGSSVVRPCSWREV